MRSSRVRIGAFVLWFVLWGALVIAAPDLPREVALGLAIAQFAALVLLRRPACHLG